MTSPSTSDAGAFLRAARAEVDDVLGAIAGTLRRDPGGRVGEAMAYALSTPGKRIRPALLIAACRAVRGRSRVSRLAAAVEIVHTYSLVHDDLPCMDDDALRRGRPTVHRAYGVATATEAGYRMVPLAARVLAHGAAEAGLEAETTGRLAAVLFRAVGVGGMIGGQVLDLEAEGRTLGPDALAAVHRAKTGALITAAAELGAIAGGASADETDALRDYAAAVGLAFQIVDDVLDATGSSAALGKTAGKDAAQAKATFVAAYGVDGARVEAERLVEAAMDRLGAAGLDSMLLEALARFIIERRT